MATTATSNPDKGSEEAKMEEEEEEVMVEAVQDDDVVAAAQVPKGTEDSSAKNAESPLPSTLSMSEKWTRAIDTVRILLCRFLNGITYHAATHPWMYIVGIVVLSITMILIGLMTNFRIEVNGDMLWPPQNSLTRHLQNWIEDESGLPPINYDAFFYVHQDDRNILGKAKDSVEKSFQVLDTITALPGYETVCRHQDSQQQLCPMQGVFLFWNESLTIFQNSVQSDVDAILQLSQPQYPSGEVVHSDAIFGNAKRDDSGILTSVQAYRIHMEFPRNEQAKELLAEIQDAGLEIQSDWDDNNSASTEDGSSLYRLEIFTSRSFDDEFQRAIVKDIVLMPGAFAVMSIFTCLVFAKWDQVRSQSLLGFGAVVSVLLSILTGYGLLFTIGVPLTSATQVVVFVIFGVGLDDAYILHGSYTRMAHIKDPIDRIQATIDDIGLSITITTMTSALAFGLGCISSIPAVRWLCLYAFPTLIIDFLYQITFFVALIVIDQRRLEDNRRDCLVCFRSNKNIEQTRSQEEEEEEEDQIQLGVDRDVTGEETNPQPLSTRFMTWYTSWLLRPWIKTIVLMVFTAMLAVFSYGTSQQEQEMEFTDLVPSDSFVKRYMEVQDKYSSSFVMQAAAYARYVDHSDPLVQEQILSHVDDLVSTGAISGYPPNIWLLDFQEFVAESTTNSINATASFVDQLDEFLSIPLYQKLYGDMIARSDDTGEILTSRIWIYMDVNARDSQQVMDQLALLRNVARDQPLNNNDDDPNQDTDLALFTHDNNYNMWEFYTVVVSELTFTTFVGVVAVSIIGMALIPHWTAVLFVLPCIATCYIDLLGFLYFTGVLISPLSYITLVMSIGLLVDFIMHVLLRYYECQGKREEKVKETLMTMGISILIGGVSTFLGVMLLAFSTSEVFRTLFRAFIGLVMLGCAYGLVLLPVVLSLVGPEDTALN